MYWEAALGTVGKFSCTKDWSQGSHHGERKKGSAERGERPQCLDNIGKSLWQEGSPGPGLESSGLRIGLARQELRMLGEAEGQVCFDL